jgi:hypothetical protein
MIKKTYHLIKQVIQNQNLAAVLNKINSAVVRMPPEQALSFLFDTNLSKDQYNQIRFAAKTQGGDIFPPYKLVSAEKSQCCPSEILQTENCIEVEWKHLLRHTLERISKLQNELIEKDIAEINVVQCMFIVSYGFDGSTQQARFNQDLSETFSDSSLFVTSMIPLRLQTSCGKILWTNQTPQSTRFCRPQRLEFAKETKEYVIGLKEKYDKEIVEFQ